MEINEYEKAVLSVVLRYPAGEQHVPQRIAAELDTDKFDSRQPNQRIYAAIQSLVVAREVPNIPNVCHALGEDLSSVGGEPYLQSLLGFLPAMGVRGPDGFETWVRVVDSAGRLRHLAMVVTEYADKTKDFETLVAKTSDVDAFLSAFMAEINAGVNRVRSSYSSISEATRIECSKLEEEDLGIVTDVIPSGWPTLEKYFIPRPATLGIITGITSMGKTQLALQLLLGVAIALKESGTPGCVAINEMEMEGWRLHRRMACSLCGVDSNDLATGRLDADDKRRYHETMEYISTLPIYFDDSAQLTTAQLEWQALALHLEHGPRVLGVSDYIELFQDKAESEELRVSTAVRNLHSLCRRTGSCEIGISQLNSSVLLTNTKIGGVGRTRYSGAVGHASDWMLEVYNPIQMRKANYTFTVPDNMTENNAYVLIEKNRDHSLGTEPFEWVPAWTRFRDMALPMNQVYAKRLVEDF